MAPECYDNNVTPKVDVWALGIAAELHMSEMCKKFVRLRYVRFHKVFLPSALEMGWKPPVGKVSRDMWHPCQTWPFFFSRLLFQLFLQAVVLAHPVSTCLHVSASVCNIRAHQYIPLLLLFLFSSELWTGPLCSGQISKEEGRHFSIVLAAIAQMPRLHMNVFVDTDLLATLNLWWSMKVATNLVRWTWRPSLT